MRMCLPQRGKPDTAKELNRARVSILYIHYLLPSTRSQDHEVLGRAGRIYLVLHMRLAALRSTAEEQAIDCLRFRSSG